MGAIICIIVGILLNAWIIYLVIFDSPKVKKIPYVSERDKFYNNMRWLGYKEWEIHSAYADIENYDEIRSLNRHMEKAFKKEVI